MLLLSIYTIYTREYNFLYIYYMREYKIATLAGWPQKTKKRTRENIKQRHWPAGHVLFFTDMMRDRHHTETKT